MGDTKIFISLSNENESSVRFDIYYEGCELQFDIMYFEAEILIDKLKNAVKLARANGEMYEDKPT